MQRRSITTAILLGSIGLCNAKPIEPVKPNILFILADDLGYHDLSCMGSKYYETPNIDKIAKGGMIFTNGYAGCQVSSPSRASLLTGQFPARHGITDWIGAESGEEWRKAGHNNQLIPAEYAHSLQKKFVTLPEALKEAGYKTFFAGKWHLGSKGSWPEDHGFDINIGGWDAGSPKGGYFSPFENPNLKDEKDGEELSMRLAKETVKFLNENNPKKSGTPVFAYLSFYAVHAPIETTQEKWSKYRQKAESNGIAASGFKMGARLPMRQTQDNPVYGGLVEAMDDAVGHVLNALNELGLDDNTIVIFTSDNGGVVSGDAFSTSNLPLRGGKGYQYEGGIREPYFIKVPGITKGGEICNEPVSGTDFYPTLLELTGQKLRPKDHADGVSLVPLLKGKRIKERPLIWHYPHYGNQGGEPSSIIRLGDWKMIHYYETDKDELFNLQTDLEEKNDVSAQHPAIVSKLHKTLFDYLNRVGAKFPKRDPNYDNKLFQTRQKEVETQMLRKLEKQRLNMLSKEFDPGNHWWGSQTTKD